MNIVLLDLAHDQTVDVNSLPIPLNIGYLKAYAESQHNNLNIKLYKQAKKYICINHVCSGDEKHVKNTLKKGQELLCLS